EAGSRSTEWRRDGLQPLPARNRSAKRLVTRQLDARERQMKWLQRYAFLQRARPRTLRGNRSWSTAAIFSKRTKHPPESVSYLGWAQYALSAHCSLCLLGK